MRRLNIPLLVLRWQLRKLRKFARSHTLKAASSLLLMCVALCAAYADPAPPFAADPISIDKVSPSVAIFGNTAADIYGEAAGGGLGGWDIGGPGPMLHIKDANYGLMPIDEQDGHSLGNNNPNAVPIVYFSASRTSLGRWGTQYRHQALRNQAAGDRFVTNGWMDKSPAASYATGIPADLVTWLPNAGPNLLSANQKRYNEIPTISIGVTNPQTKPQQIDDMDALELHEMDVTGDHRHDFALFFTLAQGSPSLPPGTSGSDIFISWPGMAYFTVWATSRSMGLSPSDDIDALVVFHVSGNETAVPGVDYALFSLRSPNSLGASASNVYVTSFLGTSKLYFTGPTIGLLPTDDVDGLDVEQFVEGQTLPQVFDEIPVSPPVPPTPLPPSRRYPNGTPVNTSGIVTYIGSNFLYIEAPDRSSGIRVEPLTPPWYVSIGNNLQVIGVLGLADGERIISPTEPVSPLSLDNPLPALIDMRTRDVGGAASDVNNPGITDGRGALNVGLRVCVTGIVTAVDPSPAQAWYYIWDGSNGRLGAATEGPLDDGSGNIGLRIEDSCVGLVPNVDHMEIDGVVSTDAASVPGKVIPVIIPRAAGKLVDFDNITDEVPWEPMYPGESGVEAQFWNLISLPAIPANWDPASVFGPYSVDVSNLWRWECTTGSFVPFDPWQSSFGGMLLGDGYWLDADSDWGVSYTGSRRLYDQWITLPVGGNRWALIGHPFGHNTWWEDVLVHDGDEVKDLRTAATGGWLSSTGWWMDNSSGSFMLLDLPENFPASCKLLVWHGYYVQTNVPQLSLIVPVQPEATPDPYSYPSDEPELVFHQVDWNYDGEIVTDSEWGRVNLNFVGDSTLLYFNLSVNGSWRVQNVPVLSVQGAGEPQTMTYHFNLGSIRGQNVNSLTYGYALTTSPLGVMPRCITTASVYPASCEIHSGMEGVPMGHLPMATDMIGGSAATVHKHTGTFPNQECGPNECVPAAVSNSLKWLNEKYKLGLSAEKTGITAAKAATGWEPDGCEPDWPDKKDAYMKANGYKITTTKMGVADIGEQIDKGQDVEVRSKVHCGAVVGFTDLGGGKYSIDVAHDTNQGEAGGTVVETVIYDSTTGKFTSGAGFAGFESPGIVVECPLKEAE